jgi:hypothetical protein
LSQNTADASKLVLTALTVAAVDVASSHSLSERFWDAVCEVWSSQMMSSSPYVMVGSAALVSYVLGCAEEVAVPSRVLSVSRQLLVWLQSVDSLSHAFSRARLVVVASISVVLSRIGLDSAARLGSSPVPPGLFNTGYDPSQRCTPTDCEDVVLSLLSAPSIEDHSLLLFVTSRVQEPSVQRKRGNTDTSRLVIHAFTACVHVSGHLPLLLSSWDVVPEEIAAAMKFAYGVKRAAMDAVKASKESRESDGTTLYRDAAVRAEMVLHSTWTSHDPVTMKELKQFIVSGLAPAEARKQFQLRSASVRILSDVYSCLSMLSRVDSSDLTCQLASLVAHRFGGFACQFARKFF